MPCSSSGPLTAENALAGHTALTVHSAQIWAEYVNSEKDLPSEFEKRMSKYNNSIGHRNVRPREKERFIKTALNYRVHDLPHAHNPETDHFVPSFTGFPMPVRGSGFRIVRLGPRGERLRGS